MIATDLGARVARRTELFLQHLVQGASEAVALSMQGQRRGALPGRFGETVMPASLKSLLAVAASGTESRAALLLGVSQPAVHRALAQLEHLSGALLLRKSMHGTRLTEGGEAMLRRVKLAVAEARAMEADVAAWSGKLRGRIVVGSLPLSVSIVLPQAVAAAMKRHPDIEITVIDGTYESLVRQLRSADIDVIVGALRPQAPDEIAQEVLMIDELGVICRPGHPCLTPVAPLRLEQLLHFPWVVPLKNTPARAALHDAFAAESLEPPGDALQATSTIFTRAIVGGSDHLALASIGEAQKDEAAGLLRIVPIKLQGAKRNIGIAVRAIGDLSPDLQALVEALRAEHRTDAVGGI